MNKFDELQAEHQHLLKEYEANRDSNELLSAVCSYIEKVRAEAESVTLARDRDQLRANLRFWASFVFDKTGIYPQTTLRPAALVLSLNLRSAPVVLLAVLLITYLQLLLVPAWDVVFAWLIAINVVTLVAFGYDKAVASEGAARVPEVILLALTLLGGSAGAVFARPLFRHKTQKMSFQVIFWPCVIVSIVLVAVYYLMLCPGCR